MGKQMENETETTIWFRVWGFRDLGQLRNLGILGELTKAWLKVCRQLPEG